MVFRVGAVCRIFDGKTFTACRRPALIHDASYFGACNQFGGHDVTGQLFTGRQQFVGADYFVDQAPCTGRVRIKVVAQSNSVPCRLIPIRPGQSLREAPAGYDAHSRMGVGKAGVGAYDQKVAHQGDFKAASNGKTIDRTNNRFAHVGNGFA